MRTRAPTSPTPAPTKAPTAPTPAPTGAPTFEFDWMKASGECGGTYGYMYSIEDCEAAIFEAGLGNLTVEESDEKKRPPGCYINNYHETSDKWVAKLNTNGGTSRRRKMKKRNCGTKRLCLCDH